MKIQILKKIRFPMKYKYKTVQEQGSENNKKKSMHFMSSYLASKKKRKRKRSIKKYNFYQGGLASA